MGGPLDVEKRNTIVRLLFHRCQKPDIAKEMGVNVALVRKIERNLLDYGTPEKPNPPKKGRPPQLTAEVEEEMLQLWESGGYDIGQKALSQWLERKHGIKMTRSSISRYIKKSGRKKAVAVVAYAEGMKRSMAQEDEATAEGRETVDRGRELEDQAKGAS